VKKCLGRHNIRSSLVEMEKTSLNEGGECAYQSSSSRLGCNDEGDDVHRSELRKAMNNVIAMRTRGELSGELITGPD
jgi:hypothetical protein